jgi:hypothetical protein
MPFVACPSCGERGKIPPTLVGARIKCKKCGISFNVAPSAAKAPAAEAQGVAAAPVAAAHEGIAVEGLDAAAWSASGDQSGDLLRVVPEAEHGPSEGAEVSQAFEAHRPTALKEYKILCSRDKIFEGQFDLARLEAALNQYARQGWIVRGMSTPHLKGFGEGNKEEIVILLER